MEYVGEHLKEERIKKKIPLNKVSNDLKIGKDIIEEIENDTLPNYLDNVFIIGHIRSYANYLGLDSNIIVENYKIQNFGYNNKSEIEIQKPIQSNFFIFFNRKISLVSIIIISLFFYLFFIDSEDLEQNFAMTPDIPENFHSLYEEAEMEIELENRLTKEKKVDQNDLIENIIKDPSIKKINKTSSSAIASLPNSNKNPIKKIITLKFIDSTWIQLRDINNEILVSKLMNKNDEYSYSLSETLYLTIGNAGNLIISIDGVVKGKAGKSGEVIDSLIIDKNFNN